MRAAVDGARSPPRAGASSPALPAVASSRGRMAHLRQRYAPTMAPRDAIPASQFAAQLPAYVPQRLRQQGQSIALRRNQQLFRIGDPVKALFYVCSGRFEAERFTPDGAPVVMLSATAGEYFAEASLEVERYTCSGRASADGCVLALPKKAVIDALRTDAEFAMAFLHAQLRNARRQCSRCERLRLRRAEDRVIHYLACEGGPDAAVRLHAPLAELAEVLGLTPEALYRALARLRATGRVECSDEQMRLLR
ncbi:MAG: Crp/Fnr family transcriptional regulator [Burkholderiaceae bacterium]